MCATYAARPDPRVPAYVREWVGRKVVAPASNGPCQGLVTSANRKRVVDGTVIVCHVALDNGLLWIGYARELHVLAERSQEHRELDGK